MTLNWKVVLSVLTLGMSGAAMAESPSPQDPQWNLMLIGSELRICSSMNSDYCANDEWINANDMRTSRLFQLTDVRRSSALRQAIWPRDRQGVREELDEMLREMVDYFARGVVSEHRLVDRFRSRAYLDLLMRLSDAEYNRILDNLEMPRLEGLDEVVNLAMNDDFSAEFITQFVAMAESMHGIANERPARILVITAGERDTFRNVDSHVQAFNQAGAEATWMPLDIAVSAAQASGRCQDLEALRRELSGTYDRDRVDPVRHGQQIAFCRDPLAWQSMLANADAVFITGGSADRLKQTFFRDNRPVALLTAMQERFTEGNLAIGAAGEGAAALVSANMITNGHSRSAVAEGSIARRPPPPDCGLDNTCPRNLSGNSLTYEPLGGLGFARFGIIDTDVSHRGRQGRLLRLAADTRSPLAMGIDRDTAIRMNTRTGAFEIGGREGVILLEGAMGTDTMLASTFHYLRTGTLGQLSGGRLIDAVMAPQEFVRPESTTNRFLGDSGIFDNIDTVCRGRNELRLLQENFELMMRVNDDSELELSRGRCQIMNGIMGIATQ
ncbi:cyanophycinase [Aliidiomarina halalkaliphila]|uniref:Cyanophycinase n=1 Tax=Aliidiomarina halalkaliphila TaxID=2593535 RepID=A0A552X007_9GAMM|nr:cyanophycinase [Aliidiomarina halalkaliphila]TRW48344.1 cyanophycinase [Aliidiomarina halalkaliphila]